MQWTFTKSYMCRDSSTAECAATAKEFNPLAGTTRCGLLEKSRKSRTADACVAATSAACNTQLGCQWTGGACLPQKYQYNLGTVGEVASEFSVTVYHPDAEDAAKPCDVADPSCCEFGVRIMDMEDPALFYPPYGPKQDLSRCATVTECKLENCQYESSGPTASSDRVCQPIRSCDPKCTYEFATFTGYSDRECRDLTYCNPFAARPMYLLSQAPLKSLTCQQVQRPIFSRDKYTVSLTLILLTAGRAVICANAQQPLRGPRHLSGQPV